MKENSKRTEDCFQASAPFDPQRRIASVDMVRGFALFGVLLVNMYNFGAYGAMWTSQVDRAAFSVMRFFFETKSWRLFSFLFGLGFSIQLLRAESRGAGFLPMYVRRMVILFSVGAVHALFYISEILMLYALLGLLLVPFRRVSPRLLLVVAVTLLAVFPVGQGVKTLVTGRSPEFVEPEVRVEEARQRNQERLQAHPYAVGSVLDVMKYNSKAIPPNPLSDPLDAESHVSFFALFILGLYAGRRRILVDIDTHLQTIRRVLWWGLGVGTAGMIVERILAAGWGYNVFGERGAHPMLEFAGDMLFAFGSTALCLGYAAAIVLLSRNGRRAWLVRPLAPVGRMALTVYLTQTAIFTTLFYGYGLGWAGRTGPAAVTACAILIFAVQVVACNWWVRFYRFGPFEWAWRSLTYMTVPAMKVGE